jgi:hypothetical protein
MKDAAFTFNIQPGDTTEKTPAFASVGKRAKMEA